MWEFGSKASLHSPEEDQFKHWVPAWRESAELTLKLLPKH